MTSDLLDRIEDKFTIGDGCWEWTAAKMRAGYGELSINGKGGQYAHRELYEYMVGPIPDELELDHLCMNKSCVRPDHLEPVTHKENMRRWQTQRAARTHCERGHEWTEDNISTDNRGRQECLTCKRRRSLTWLHKQT